MKVRTLAPVAVLCLIPISAYGHVEVFQANMSGLFESPPNASPATGFTTVTMDLDLFTMRVQANFSGLIGTTSASHVHVRPNLNPGNGPVATQLPSFSGFPLGVTSGSFDQTFDMTLASSYNPAFITNNGGTVSTAFGAFLQAMRDGRTYLNIHTTTFPGGEIRGDLQAVPEPATLTIIGLGAIALMRRNRKN